MNLVGGAITILKNMSESQWEGWHPIYEMENNSFMFETTNQMRIVDHLKNWALNHRQSNKSGMAA